LTLRHRSGLRVKRGNLSGADRRRRERAEAVARAQGILDELKHVIDDQPMVLSGLVGATSDRVARDG
jgi:hypothetical protein